MCINLGLALCPQLHIQLQPLRLLTASRLDLREAACFPVLIWALRSPHPSTLGYPFESSRLLQHVPHAGRVCTLRKIRNFTETRISGLLISISLVFLLRKRRPGRRRLYVLPVLLQALPNFLRNAATWRYYASLMSTAAPSGVNCTAWSEVIVELTCKLSPRCGILNCSANPESAYTADTLSGWSPAAPVTSFLTFYLIRAVTSAKLGS